MSRLFRARLSEKTIDHPGEYAISATITFPSGTRHAGFSGTFSKYTTSFSLAYTPRAETSASVSSSIARRNRSL